MKLSNIDKFFWLVPLLVIFIYNFIFPNMSIFDFLPDALAQKEAEEIRKNPPKAIVYLNVGEAGWKAHE